MRNVLLVALMLMMVGMATAGGTGGRMQDQTWLKRRSQPTKRPPFRGRQNMDLTVTLDQAAVDNGTTMELTTQICTNDGVCDPPVSQEATVSDDGSTYTSR